MTRRTIQFWWDLILTHLWWCRWWLLCIAEVSGAPQHGSWNRFHALNWMCPTPMPIKTNGGVCSTRTTTDNNDDDTLPDFALLVRPKNSLRAHSLFLRMKLLTTKGLFGVEMSTWQFPGCLRWLFCWCGHPPWCNRKVPLHIFLLWKRCCLLPSWTLPPLPWFLCWVFHLSQPEKKAK